MIDLILVTAIVGSLRYPRRTYALATASEHIRRGHMNFEYLVGALLSAALTAYLVYALVRPERF